MWTRADLKYRAKNVLRNCFWAAVMVCLVTSILTGGFSRGGNTSNSNNKDNYYNGLQEGGAGTLDTAKDIIGDNLSGMIESPEYLISRIAGTGFGLIVMGLGLFMLILGLAIGILVGNPIRVGSCRFFMCSRENTTKIGELFYTFRQKEFWNVVFIMLVMNVKIFLWSLLFVIPGIIKSYEYYMIPYILSENPGISMSQAFQLSREMTYGEKMNIFILGLSFLPWQILSSFTCGMVGIFWVNPYVSATNAELYAVLRQRILDSGYTNAYDLPGFEGYQSY